MLAIDRARRAYLLAMCEGHANNHNYSIHISYIAEKVNSIFGRNTVEDIRAMCDSHRARLFDKYFAEFSDD